MEKQDYLQQLKTYEQAHTAGTPLLSDLEYDAFVEQYEAQFGEPYVRQVMDIIGNNVLPIDAPSLSKKKTQKDIHAFDQKYPGTKIVSDKIDGYSVICHYFNNTQRVYTHSNAKEGVDITHLLEYLHIPTSLKGEWIVRGELAIKLSVFEEKYKEKYTPRGILRVITNKIPEVEIVKDFTYTAFQLTCKVENVIKPLTVSQQFDKLKELGFNVVRHWTVESLEFDTLTNELENNTCAFLRDGLVIAQDLYEEITENVPKNKIAFKIEGETAETIVTHVEWIVSSHCILIPKIHYKPVYLDNGNLTSTAGFNAKFILDHNIGPGAKILMTRSGSIIPYLKTVLQGTEASMPIEEYEWDKTKTNIKVKINDQVKIRRINAFFETLEVKFLGIKTVEKLFQSGFTTVNDLIVATVDDLVKVEGIKKTGATRIVKQISDAVKKANLLKVMDGSCVFPGFGESKLSAILNTLPQIYDIVLFNTQNIQITISEVQKVDGIKEMAQVFVTQLPVFIEFLNAIPSVKQVLINKQQLEQSIVSINVSAFSEETHEDIIITPSVVAPTQNLIFTNQVIVFSGDKKLTSKVKMMGGIVDKGVTKRTTLLVVEEVGTMNNKERMCMAKKIPIMSLEEFKNKYNL